ncbi:MAG: cation transporter [Deltaproteobacteria bacterium]|nr:cation transporter [Deltaproteobacteria bacterium]
MASGSRTAVIAALIGNLIIAVFKLVVAMITFSSAMMAEAVHSFADTGNQGLLLFGMRRSARPADEEHPFGYGQEQYFWSFVVANMIFFVGAVVSIYEGIHKLQDPQPIERAWLIYVVLGVSFVIEASAMSFAVREFNRTRPRDIGIYQAVRRSKDTNVVVVLFEDSAALLGLFVAFVGVLLADLTGWMIFDSLASITIGVLLASVAFLLARETKELLIGEAASKKHLKAIREATLSIDQVKILGLVRTMHLAPQKILVTMDVEFIDELDTDGVEDAIDQIEAAIRKVVPAVDTIYIEAERVLTADRVAVRRPNPAQKA